jgi:hypothetical protein
MGITGLFLRLVVNPTNPNFYNGGARTTTAAIMKGAGAGLANELTLRPRLEYGVRLMRHHSFHPLNGWYDVLELTLYFVECYYHAKL